MMRRVFAMTLLMLGFGVAAHADILVAGPMFGGSTQTDAVCYLYNAGTGAVTVTSNQLIREPNINLTLNFDTCGTLSSGRVCAIATNITNNAAHVCRFVISPSWADVRGTLEIRAGGTVLQNSELR